MNNINVIDIKEYKKAGIIPLTQVASQQFNIVLGNGENNAINQNCTIAIYQKDEDVFVDLIVDNVLVFAGIKALDRTGLKISEYMGLKGQIWFEDTNGTENPKYTGFGNRWVLYYGYK